MVAERKGSAMAAPNAPDRDFDFASVGSFQEYLDKMESHCRARIERADQEEKAEKVKGGQLSLGAYIGRQKSHEQLRDIEVVRAILAAFEQYTG